MSSAQVCVLLVLVAIATVVADPIPETVKAYIHECAQIHGVADVKATFLSPDNKYACFYACVIKRAKENIKNPESPKAKAFFDCDASVAKSGDECADALEIKKCMLAKFQAAFPLYHLHHED